MANIAQTVNVLQALIFTQEDKILLTPTYHIFEMYKVHHDATLLPLDLKCGDYEYDGKKLPALSASASRNKDGIVHISIVNIHPEEGADLTIDMRGAELKDISGRIFTSDNYTDHNTFENPEKLKPGIFKDIKINKNELTGTIPAKSVIVLEIK